MKLLHKILCYFNFHKRFTSTIRPFGKNNEHYVIYTNCKYCDYEYSHAYSTYSTTVKEAVEEIEVFKKAKIQSRFVLIEKYKLRTEYNYGYHPFTYSVYQTRYSQ